MSLQRLTDERDVRRRPQIFERYSLPRRYRSWEVRPMLGSTTRQLLMTTGRYVVNVIGHGGHHGGLYAAYSPVSSDFALPTSGARCLALNIQQTHYGLGPGELSQLTITSAATMEEAIATSVTDPTTAYFYVRIPIAAWDSDGNIEQIVTSLLTVTVNTWKGVQTYPADVTAYQDGLAMGGDLPT